MVLATGLRRCVCVGVWILGLALLVPEEAAAQRGGGPGNGDINGVAHRVEALEAQVAQLMAAVSALQSGLSNETAARQEADAMLQNNINTEVSARERQPRRTSMAKRRPAARPTRRCRTTSICWDPALSRRQRLTPKSLPGRLATIRFRPP